MKRLFNKVLFSNLQFAENGHDIRHKFIFLNNVYFFACIVAFVMGFIRWKANGHLMGGIDFGFSAISIALLYYLRHHKKRIELLSSIALTLSFILFFAIYLLASNNVMRLSLFFLLSASAFFLKGRKTGFFWIIFILLSILAGHFSSYFNTAYTNLDIFTTSVYLVALFFIFDNYEIIKEEQREYLERLNLHLGVLSVKPRNF